MPPTNPNPAPQPQPVSDADIAYWLQYPYGRSYMTISADVVRSLCREVQAARREQRKPVAAGAPSQALTAEDEDLLRCAVLSVRVSYGQSTSVAFRELLDKLLAAAGVAGKGATASEAKP